MRFLWDPKSLFYFSYTYENLELEIFIPVYWWAEISYEKPLVCIVEFEFLPQMNEYWL